MSDDSFLAETVASIRKELSTIAGLREELTHEMAKPEPSRRAIGSILHDFYNCCERIFRRISTEINGAPSGGDSWHKELLYRMTVPVEDRRPVVLSTALAADLDDYLSFRHVFRNIYGFELQGERLSRLASLFPAVSRRFEEEIRAFLGKIDLAD
jgi:hypothetical protein